MVSGALSPSRNRRSDAGVVVGDDVLSRPTAAPVIVRRETARHLPKSLRGSFGGDSGRKSPRIGLRCSRRSVECLGRPPPHVGGARPKWCHRGQQNPAEAGRPSERARGAENGRRLQNTTSDSRQSTARAERATNTHGGHDQDTERGLVADGVSGRRAARRLAVLGRGAPLTSLDHVRAEDDPLPAVAEVLRAAKNRRNAGKRPGASGPDAGDLPAPAAPTICATPCLKKKVGGSSRPGGPDAARRHRRRFCSGKHTSPPEHVLAKKRVRDDSRRQKRKVPATGIEPVTT